MPKTTCATCGGTYEWIWEEAFEKFGFGDGDGQVMTPYVADVLRNAGYTVHHEFWSIHNDVITGMTKDGREIITDAADVGHAPPRTYLPKEVIRLLDRELGPDVEVDL